ncbi:hypothetical protein BKA63DRAFT_199 [Paraphoma chrysanthemicola]|nr:hypothetical protein BKA63DRAFT_199 [Paraphoma chrysanthemicola]
MFAKIATITIALVATALAAPTLQARQTACQDAYIACIADGTRLVVCGCSLNACVGQDNFLNREYCASATASLSNPASSVFSSATSSASSSVTSSLSSSSSYVDTTTVSSTTPHTSVSSIPTSTTTKAPLPTITSPPNAPIAPGSNPVLISPAKSWTISNLTRYCGEGNTACDYNFAVTADGNTELCTVNRKPGSSAATESWSNQKCNSGSSLTISWGYVTDPAPAFAVITVVKGAELAWFGVADVNGGAVTPDSPFGSGQFGTLPASPVYTYT